MNARLFSSSTVHQSPILYYNHTNDRYHTNGFASPLKIAITGFIGLIGFIGFIGFIALHWLHDVPKYPISDYFATRPTLVHIWLIPNDT